MSSAPLRLCERLYKAFRMKRAGYLAAFILGLLTCAIATAGEPRLFEPGSLEAIRAARAGRPFVLALWSLDCGHCRDELALLARTRQAQPRLDLVLVSTDAPEARALAARSLEAAGLGSVESWIFGAEAPERLRWAIDRKWRGELPRTYFFDAEHRVSPVSGKLDPARLARWLEQQAAVRP